MARCKACDRELTQQGRGHRQREYCDDECRQTGFRMRREQAHRNEINRRWAAFTPETRSFLDWLTGRYGENLAVGIEHTINRELGRCSAESSAQLEPQLAALREQPQPRAVLSMEQAHERAGLHGYLDDGAYLASTRRLFVRVFQTGRIEPNEIREVIHQERGAETDRLRQRIAELEQELADTSQGRDQVQERFRKYVCMTNERVGELTGELATRRQEQERAAGQEDQRNIEDYQEKLLQAGQRLTKLEKQVDIQRQRLGQYYQRFYPSSLAVAAQKLMALGAAMNYKILLKYDSQAVEVPSGEAAWCEFATHANYDEVAQAIVQAQFLFDNLYALGMLGYGDNQVSPNNK